MSSRFAIRLALPIAALTTLALSGSLALGTPPGHACRGGLTAKMTHIAGSDALGHTAYRLTVTNSNSVACGFDSNHPALTLYKGASATSKQLPTHVIRQGKTHAFKIGPGQSAHARLFFSPDVPGKNEPQRGPCEPTAHSVGVTLSFTGSSSQGAVAVRAHGPIVPPTSVCEHGQIQESALH